MLGYGHEESSPGFLASHTVPLYPACHGTWPKKPLQSLCGLTRCTAVGGWGCTLCVPDLLSGDAEPTTCREQHQPLLPALPPWASVLPALRPPSSHWTGNLPARAEGHTATPQQSLGKSLKPQVLPRNLKGSYLKPFRWKEEHGHISGFSGVILPLGISLCQSSERKGSSKKSKQHLFRTTHRPITQGEIFCPLL